MTAVAGTQILILSKLGELIASAAITMVKNTSDKVEELAQKLVEAIEASNQKRAEELLTQIELSEKTQDARVEAAKNSATGRAAKELAGYYKVANEHRAELLVQQIDLSTKMKVVGVEVAKRASLERAKFFKDAMNLGIKFTNAGKKAIEQLFAQGLAKGEELINEMCKKADEATQRAKDFADKTTAAAAEQYAEAKDYI